MRHEPCDAPTAVDERVNPRQPVMRSRRRQDDLGLAQPAVLLFEPLQKARNRRWTDRYEVANCDVAGAPLAGNDLHTLMCCGIFNPKHVLRQGCAEASVNLTERFSSRGATPKRSIIDPLLDTDMRLRFQLEIALFRFPAVVALQRALDIDRVRIMALDQIAVVAVH